MKLADAGTEIDAAAMADDDEVNWVAILSPSDKDR
jgi:hypothetical protein